MRRLTLILSDLYVPEEAGRKMPSGALELPNFEWLLRHAHVSSAWPNWREWLAAHTGQVELAHSPIAQIASRGIVEPSLAASAWIATPVHLEARLDHVRLTDRGLLRIGTDEARGWSEAFAREFGPVVSLHPAGERGFLLTGLSATHVATVDPARLLDSDVAQSLPRGADAGGLRRLGAELEMWLHATPLNVERERAGHPRISAFWFWGGEPLPDLIPPPSTPLSSPGKFVVHGSDIWLAGFAHDARSAAQVAQFPALDPAVEHHIVELSPMSAPRESLADVEARWFLPARKALAEGKLTALDIVANDRWFRLGPRAGWRWWRKRRDWLESLV